MYKFLRNILFAFDAEEIHHFTMNGLKVACSMGLGKLIRKQFKPSEPGLQRDVFGIHFTNPVGLAAGFDKNAKYLKELSLLGFGCVEIGTVTPLPQPGNEKPRLFRLPKDKALINRMGFNNDGAAIIAARLREWRNKQRKENLSLVIGGNIGKNKFTPNEDAWKDYGKCFTALMDHVDYFVVNVSSPNTPGLRQLQEKGSLEKIFNHLAGLNTSHKPVLLKIAPDLNRDELDEIIQLALEIKLDGLIISNTTVSRDDLVTDKKTIEKIGPGGLSGKPLMNRSTEVLKYIASKTNGSIPIIASGGIFDGRDAKEKIDAGASLVQVYTGFIYSGPSIVKNICRALS